MMNYDVELQICFWSSFWFCSVVFFYLSLYSRLVVECHNCHKTKNSDSFRNTFKRSVFWHHLVRLLSSFYALCRFRKHYKSAFVSSSRQQDVSSFIFSPMNLKCIFIDMSSFLKLRRISSEQSWDLCIFSR